MPDFSFLDDSTPEPRVVVRAGPAVRRKAAPWYSGPLGCLKMAALVPVVFVAAAIWVGSGLWVPEPAFDPGRHPKRSNKQPGATAAAHAQEEQDAKYFAEQFVLKMLKAPRTAKFPGFFDGPDEVRVSRMDDGTYVVESYVDAQNSFGALLRRRYRVQIRLHPGGRGELVDGGLLE